MQRPARPGARGGERASAAELEDVLHRAARVSDGLALLERAPAECAAVLLGVPPPAIERVRSALEDGAARDAARALLARAATRLPSPVAEGARASAPRDAEELVAAAAQRPRGIALLLAASPECAAVVFGVHPDLVHRARELARRRGLSQDLPSDA